MATAKSKNNDNGRDMSSLIEQFCSVTGCNAETGEHMLEACGGNLQMAVSMFLDSGGTPSASTSTNGQQNYADRHTQDEVRAPIPQRKETLVEEQHVRVIRGRKRTSCVFDGLRDFEAETKLKERERQAGVPPSSFTGKRRTLQDLFRPPVDLIHKGPLQSARDAAVEANRWLMVNLQNVQEFCCQVLNRDVWSNGRVKAAVRASFVFWQAYHDGDEGKRFVQFYKVKEWPHVAVLDPRTGESIVVWSKFDATSLCEIITEFLSQKPAPDMSLVKSPVKKSAARHSIVDASEDSQLEAAIQMSLAEGASATPPHAARLHADGGDDDSRDTYELETFSDSDVDSAPAVVSPVKRPPAACGRVGQGARDDDGGEACGRVGQGARDGADREKAEACGRVGQGTRDGAGGEACGRVGQGATDDVGGEQGGDKTTAGGDERQQQGSTTLASDNRGAAGDSTGVTQSDSTRTATTVDGPHAGPTSQILIRFPNGLRKNFTLPVSSKLQVIEELVAGEGWPKETHELLTNFPRRNLSQLHCGCTLQEAGFFSQETVYVQARV